MIKMTKLAKAFYDPKWGKSVPAILLTRRYIDFCDETGLTPLHRAVSNGNFEAVTKLVENGANPNVQDCDGWTPLHYAVDIGDTDIIMILLLHGADTLLKNDEGLSPLDFALEKVKQNTLH